MTAPIPYQWDGDAMIPLARFKAKCDELFAVGEVVTLENVLDRSNASHRHYFAAIHDAWANLPEHLADRFPTSEHLRKWALIKAGYRDEQTFVASSRKLAAEIAAFCRKLDDYAIVLTDGSTVVAYTAKSQAYRAMGKAKFQRSKDDVLDVIAQLIEVGRAELEAAAGKAA